MEYLLVALKDRGEGLASSLRALFDAARVWLELIVGIGVVLFLLWLFSRFRRSGSR